MTFLEQYVHPLSPKDYIDVMKREAIMYQARRIKVVPKDEKCTLRPPALPVLYQSRQLALPF